MGLNLAPTWAQGCDIASGLSDAISHSRYMCQRRRGYGAQKFDESYFDSTRSSMTPHPTPSTAVGHVQVVQSSGYPVLVANEG